MRRPAPMPEHRSGHNANDEGTVDDQGSESDMGGAGVNTTPITRGEYDQREKEHRDELDQLWSVVRKELPDAVRSAVEQSEERIIKRIDDSEAQQTKEHEGVTKRLDAVIDDVDSIKASETDEESMKRALILIAKIGAGMLTTLATIVAIAVGIIQIFGG